MKSFFYIAILALTIACGNSKEPTTDTILKGKVSILVENSMLPIVEEQEQVFESQYQANITLIPATESQISANMSADKNRIAFLPRRLSAAEEQAFKKKNINGKIIFFAFDALVFFQARTVSDTLLKEEAVYELVKGQNVDNKRLVFCNADLSLLENIKRKANITKLESANVSGFETELDVANYLLKNENAIGVLPLNRVLSPSFEFEQILPKLRAMAVKSVKKADRRENYFKPNQANIAEGLYPFSRTLYLLNYQGRPGLGMGFASFIAGDIGQRIVLKSGLVPVQIPPRIIATRKKIIKN
ncbi:PstS family phosphate ABC transporter substrate-binding protein [Flavobacterium aurantiibacter]|uniref:PBP domain-containing protein n=1 Tax=Flavobacterium aurantiibacter TaxID=2023067 RepID=A0A255ZVZ4_9FLAO|nr:substrate-binding domain-containing protein [Flavobacterium aurantiibacter]OYQ45075.1 hypothetical protein CHX27_06820 [Flavobacterium aurantiibacter]